MRIGQLREIVDIRTYARAQDATTGERTDTYATPGRTVYASVMPLSAREFIEAQATNSRLTHTVVIRYLEPIPSPKDRIVYGTRVFEIMAPAINQGERDRFLVLKCEEKLTAATLDGP